MGSGLGDRVRSAEVVLPCAELDATLAFFTERLGFQLESISPADHPVTAAIFGHGVRIRLRAGAAGDPGTLRLWCDGLAASAGGATELTAPNGTRVELVEADPPLELPPIRRSFVLTKLGGDSVWSVGRAGMRYRDLIPDRRGGRFIASHIRIEHGGPVPDYVHFHRIRFQMIFCYRGWVRVAYEDQGPPLVMNAGDCVLQPPLIRHRVLECSPGLEVIEIGSPAEHETRADPDLRLPTRDLRPERDFGGQRFVHHVAAAARWQPWRLDGFEQRDLGIAAATDGLGGARVVRASGAPVLQACSTGDAELLFLFVLQGTVSLCREERPAELLAAGDCFVVPDGLRHGLAECSGDLELLEVSLPATFETVREPDGLLAQP